MSRNYEVAIAVLKECLEACNVCFDSSLKESNLSMMTNCIRLTRECADVCAFTLQALTRNSPISKELIEFCARICERCETECSNHNHHHCKRCAETCKKCAEACQGVVAS